MTTQNAIKELSDYMSELSEKAYCATWMEDLEYALWDAVLHGSKEYGRLQITSRHILKLKRLSDACGGWIIWDNGRKETFIPMEDWLKIYSSKKSPQLN
jgi:hypothetical protein